MCTRKPTARPLNKNVSEVCEKYIYGDVCVCVVCEYVKQFSSGTAIDGTYTHRTRGCKKILQL